MCPADNIRNLEALLFARQPAAVTERLRGACIGVAGCGGLGSVVAENLARAGIGKLVIADYDVVEPSNLNRQRYFVSQIGLAKVEALRDNLQRANPFVEIVPVREKVTAANCALFFSACAVVAECFDNPVSKAAIVTGLRKNLPGCVVVAASGLAGTGDGNAIKTRKFSDRFFVVGDMLADADTGIGLFAARVGIAASMQAHLIIRLIAGEHV